jgi:hypothetical protein
VTPAHTSLFKKLLAVGTRIILARRGIANRRGANWEAQGRHIIDGFESGLFVGQTGQGET